MMKLVHQCFTVLLGSNQGAICQMKNTHELDTFWSAIPRLPGSQMIRETLTVTKLNRQSSSQDILLWIQYLHSCDMIKEHQGQVIARELKKILVSTSWHLYLLGEKSRQFWSFQRNVRMFFLSEQTGTGMYIWVENSKWWGFSFFPLLSLNQPQGLVSCNFFSKESSRK